MTSISIQKYLNIAFCLAVALLLSNYFSSQKPAVELKKQYLMFPTPDTILYQDKELTIPLDKKLERGILVSEEEKISRIVGVILENRLLYTSYDALSYTPDENEEVLIKNWQEAISKNGVYTDASVDINETDKGYSNVKLTLADKKHARSEFFEYVTDGKNIISMGTTNKSSALDHAIPAALLALSTLFTMSHLAILKIKTRNQSKH